MHHSSSLSEIWYLRKREKLSLEKIRDKNLSRLKLKKKTSYGRPSHNNASSSSIFPRTVFPRFDIERLALLLDEDSVGMKLSRSDRPPFLRDGLPSLTPLHVWYLPMAPLELVWEHVFSICCSDRITFYFHINIEIKLMKNYCKKRIVRIVILYHIYI